MRTKRSTYIRAAALSALILAATPALADYRKTGPADEKDHSTLSEAKVYFTGEVTAQKAAALFRALDDANISYPKLKHIYLYIDSYGGDMDSGYAAYWAIKSSRTPVTTVNLATVMSSATMMFCGGKERASMKGGRFILHPAAAGIELKWAQPDQLAALQKNVSEFNRMFADTYRECTNMNETEISHTLYSENQREFLLPHDAISKKMISVIADKIVDTPVSYSITDSS